MNRILLDYSEYRFVLFVDVDNVKTIKLYKKLGFETCGKIANIEIHK